MTEAARRLLDYLFETFGLHRVSAICDVENTASARVLERLGMRREGHFVESVWFKGRWGSEYGYALLRREWEQQHAR
jgi:RimJ/RimL family protein N-acetyltransferase